MAFVNFEDILNVPLQDDISQLINDPNTIFDEDLLNMINNIQLPAEENNTQQPQPDEDTMSEVSDMTVVDIEDIIEGKQTIGDDT